jgi:hypothetical protein
VETYVTDVSTSRTPQEGAHSPSWPNGLNIIIIIIIIIISNAYSLSWPNGLTMGNDDGFHRVIYLQHARSAFFRPPASRILTTPISGSRISVLGSRIRLDAPISTPCVREGLPNFVDTVYGSYRKSPQIQTSFSSSSEQRL